MIVNYQYVKSLNSYVFLYQFITYLCLSKKVLSKLESYKQKIENGVERRYVNIENQFIRKA